MYSSLWTEKSWSGSYMISMVGGWTSSAEGQIVAFENLMGTQNHPASPHPCFWRRPRGGKTSAQGHKARPWQGTARNPGLLVPTQGTPYYSSRSWGVWIYFQPTHQRLCPNEGKICEKGRLAWHIWKLLGEWILRVLIMSKSKKLIVLLCCTSETHIM